MEIVILCAQKSKQPVLSFYVFSFIKSYSCFTELVGKKPN